MRYLALVAASLVLLGAGVAEGAPTRRFSEPQATQGVAALERDCKAGRPSACRTLGDVYRAGADPGRAAPFYKLACDGRDSDACLALGLLYFHGSGIQKDPTRAAALFKQACDARVMMACTSLGLQYDKGLGVPKDATRANALWDQACQQGEPLACQNRALVFRDENDLRRAEEFFRKACDGGLQASCQAFLETTAESRRRQRELSELLGRKPISMEQFLKEPQEVCARHILIKVDPEEPASGAEAKARRRAQAILTALKAKPDFAELARKSSEDASTAKGGGDLGCFARGVLVQEFENVAFALKVGETSEVVRTPFGFHVIQRVAKAER